MGKRVQAMPTLPTPPGFRGLTVQEKPSLMKTYGAYCCQITGLEVAFFRPFRMQFGACVEDERRRRIAKFDICKLLDAITETDWLDYFWEGHVTAELDFDNVKSIINNRLRIGMRWTDTNSCVSKLVHEMYQILEQENMEWMVEGESKKIVNYLIDVLGFGQFQRIIRNGMAREVNKPLFKNAVSFIFWLRSILKNIYGGSCHRSSVTRPEATRIRLMDIRNKAEARGLRPGDPPRPNTKAATRSEMIPA